MPRTLTQTVYSRAITNAQNRMINNITRDIVETDTKELLKIWDTEGEPFDLMMKSREGDPSTHRFKSWMDEVKAETSTGKYALDISDKLPFMEMMIGAGDDDTNEVHNLSGLLDSGGCCNMGWEDYHQNIYKNFPYLVANYFKLSEKQFEDINIGGIKDDVWITHMIEYWIPFQKAGGIATTTIGLT
jgi:hypothetical protein